MFALIETETVPVPPFYERIREKFRANAGVKLGEDTSVGVKILCANITFWCGMPEKIRIRRMEKAMAAIAASGIRSVVIPRGFEYGNLLEKYRLQMTSPEPFIKKMAARLVLYAIETFQIPGDVTAAIISERPTSDFTACLEILVKKVRHVGLFCGSDTRDYCERVRQEYGVAVMEGIPSAMRNEPGLFIAFDPIGLDKLSFLHKDTLVLALGGMKESAVMSLHMVADGAVFYPPKRLEGFMVREMDVNSLLFALYCAGAVTREEIIISGLTYNGRHIRGNN